MSQGIKTFYVCTESKWDETATFEWREVWQAGYVEAAQRIAKYLDSQDGDVQERRQFWLKQEDHEKPMLMNNFSEMVVEYYAEISK